PRLRIRGVHAELDRAELQQVAIMHFAGLEQRLAIERCAVLAAEIAYDGRTTEQHDLRVLTRNLRIVEDDVVGRRAPDRDGLLRNRQFKALATGTRHK